jgi:peptide methionine sulfoxide reductase MsrA
VYLIQGTQYASVIFVADKAQHEIAQKVVNELQLLLDKNMITAYSGKTVTTKILMATKVNFNLSQGFTSSYHTEYSICIPSLINQ